MHSKLRCRNCREWFPRAEFYRSGYHSAECLRQKLNETNNKSAGTTKKNKRLPPEIAKAVRERDHQRCRWCNVPRSLQVHHVKYRSEQGPDEPANLLLLCAGCHRLAHSSKQTYQPLLLTCLWLEYFHGAHLTVPQTQKWLKSLENRGERTDN